MFRQVLECDNPLPLSPARRIRKAAEDSAPYTDRLRPVSRSDSMTVAVGLSPRLPEARIRVAERRLGGRICQPFKRRSATPTRWVLHRGLKPTATLGRRSATIPNQLSTIRVTSSED